MATPSRGSDRTDKGIHASQHTGIITIVARNTITGEPIRAFKYSINEDNTGDPQVELPPARRDPALFPSLRPTASYSPVVAAGAVAEGETAQASVPAGKYLVTVLAPGFKLGGTWVAVTGGETATAEVRLHPHPLPLSKIRVHVFHDNHPVNGEDDFPLEEGLPGFRIAIADTIDEVTVDYFGHPLGTVYERDASGNLLLDEEGNPIPVPGTGGKILTDANGDAVIENLPPGKYAVQAVPPDGTDWIQTTTIEGTRVIDAWIEEGNDGYLYEEGFRTPLVWIGFVRPMAFGPPVPGVTGTIEGRIRTVVEFAPPDRPLLLGEPVDRPWIALTDIGGDDRQVYTGRGDDRGYFTIENVPPGLYQMAIWDEPLDHIISFRTVRVAPGETVDMGEIGIPRWFGRIEGTVFVDADGNGVRDPGEPGIPDVEVGTRFKDGSVQYRTITDPKGHYVLPEVFELERFAVAEVASARFAHTGATGTVDPGVPAGFPTGCTDPAGNPVRCPERFPGALTLAELTWAASTNRIDWGKRPYRRGENGGISGIVYYATMRNETDPRYAVAEDYEPGVPGVRVNLYAAEIDPATGAVTQGALLNTTTTDGWEQPTGCVDPEGHSVPCLELPRLGNQIRPGVFDGAYVFATCFDPYYGAPEAVEKGLPAGTYIVEVVPPPGFKMLEAGAVNTGEGDRFTADPDRAAVGAARVRMAPPPYYLLPVPPGYDPARKVVILEEGMNAVADFFIYTEVPVPGRIFGWLLDDLNLETDPDSIYYGEKRGIPWTPVGIRDFTGRLLTTVHTDANGVFEVLLPSSYTRNVPIPSGVAPGMYQVIGNDPGDPDRPNPRYNPNYQSLKLVFDVWPGKTTYADVAVFPLAPVGLAAAGLPEASAVDARGRPEIHRVDRVVIEPGGERTVRIYGKDFGAKAGRVYLDDTSAPVRAWSETEIAFTVPFMPGGPKQLSVRRADGRSTAVGLTLHLLGGAYRPPVIRVPEEAATIQAAVDAAAPGSLIVVAPGTYYENPILYKNVKLQGMGAPATVIDGRFFRSYREAWRARLAGIDFDGPETAPPVRLRTVGEGQTITVVAKKGAFGRAFRTQIDGFTITGARGESGGGIYLHAHCAHLVISNNIISGNGGGFGGGITIGKPYAGSCHNPGIRIHHNRITKNGGISLAGGIAVFNGADGYEIDHTEVIGNYSGEYGGGLSHLGRSDGGAIHHNVFLYNESFDEGGGLLIGGEQPMPPAVLGTGSGRVAVYANLIQGNLANDDGGGLRLLRTLNHPIEIFNNLIVNNVSTDLGGGIALDDAANVAIYNNTVAGNITTATAEDSDGRPHGAGLVSEAHSAAFRATLPEDAPGFSDPVLFNNIFWDNRAGFYDQTLGGGAGGIAGIGAPGDTHPINVMDLEVFGTPGLFNPQYCCLSRPYPAGRRNQVGDPGFARPHTTELAVTALRKEPAFKTVRIVNPTPGPAGAYHLTDRSAPAVDRGTRAVTVIRNGAAVTYRAPAKDLDGRRRPRGGRCDLGAYEYCAEKPAKGGRVWPSSPDVSGPPTAG
ncbi:MAG: pectin esterase [Firmicutes bacterium]|nr:pectin esterase [Bacillota bacterium]